MIKNLILYLVLNKLSDKNKIFNETTDLYIEMLINEQKVEAQKLISLIKKKINKLNHKSFPTVDGCEIIFSPRHFIIPINETLIDDSDKFYKNAYRYLAIFATLYILFVLNQIIIR